MRELLNESGKIYILIATSLIVLLGFGLYLVSINKTITKLEKERSSENGPTNS